MKDKIQELIKSGKIWKLFKFGCIGVLNTAVDYLSFSLFFYVVHLSKYVSQFLAVCVAATNSYLLNNNITFKNEKQSGFKAYFKFMGVNFVAVGTSLVLMFVFSDLLGLKPIIAKVPISLITILLSFTVYDKWVFTKLTQKRSEKK